MSKYDKIGTEIITKLSNDVKSSSKKGVSEVRTQVDPEKAKAMEKQTGLSAQANYGKAMIGNKPKKNNYVKPETKQTLFFKDAPKSLEEAALAIKDAKAKQEAIEYAYRMGNECYIDPKTGKGVRLYYPDEGIMAESDMTDCDYLDNFIHDEGLSDSCFGGKGEKDFWGILKRDIWDS